MVIMILIKIKKNAGNTEATPLPEVLELKKHSKALNLAVNTLCRLQLDCLLEMLALPCSSWNLQTDLDFAKFIILKAKFLY